MNEYAFLIEDYIRKKQEDKAQVCCAATWLDSASKRASQLSLVTHVLKFTHCEAKGANIYAKKESGSEENATKYVSTASLVTVYDDVVGNAAAMDIAGLLLLKVKEVTLIEAIMRDNSFPFDVFTDCKIRLSSWMTGFKSVVKKPDPSSHTLAKQVYFPVQPGRYHILAPLYPSSLSHTLFSNINEARFGVKAKEGRECKKKGEYSDTVIIDYPMLAIQKFGGNKPQNISYLNSRRKGKAFLLRSAPPIWKSIKKPPLKKNAFWKIFERAARQELREFKEYLVNMKGRNNMQIRDYCRESIEQLVDLLIFTAVEIQAFEPGWSKDSELSHYEQIWLDPMREGVAENRVSDDWRVSISKTFATWVIQKLKDKTLVFSDDEHQHLSEFCYKGLKEVEF